MKRTNETHWDNVASWYDAYLGQGDTYQAKVIAPNLIRMVGVQKGMHILDLACGQGYFSRLLSQEGARVTGVDASKELIDRARAHGENHIQYHVAPAEKTKLFSNAFDAVVVVLAFENIKPIDAVCAEINRVLKQNSRAYIVLLHPAFRIPQHSDWKFDSAKQLQYRRIDRYLSEIAITIEQAPFKGKKSITTTTYHRSFQWYMKVFRKNGFAITALEEWISHKQSEQGPRKEAEDRARKEFPMFLALELTKLPR